MPTEPAPVDPRVHRSRAMLRDALLGLIRERGFDTISVQDITGRARLNRSTFYLHYRDKDDLLTQIMRDMLSELALRSQEVSAGPDLLQHALVEWFRHAAEHAELYHLMLGQSGMRAYSVQLRNILEQLIAPGLTTSAHPRLEGVPASTLSRFLISAYMGVLESWLDRRSPDSPEDMARWLWALTSCLETPLTSTPGAT
ncbi:TetR/AcrR family transcriptional regulator [Cystobacter fuscus]|uniref:TetR/AcrR family transcriptional regulator n=1 Tax=Cystobacter fuscus TaxID=43 RepID=UPI0037C0D226